MCKIKDEHELCVETVSLDQNLPEVFQYDRHQSYGKGGWRQSSSFDQDTRSQDTSGYLATVLSRVRASDFPKLDFENEQFRAGAAESWLQLVGLK